jgi:predicted aspartyl protease
MSPLFLLAFGCSDAPQQHIVVPFYQDARQRVAIEVQASDGQGLGVMIDTGFSSSLMMRPEVAKRFNLTFIPFISRKIGGVTSSGSRARFAFFKITKIGTTPGDWDMAVGVVDALMVGHEAIIGMNFLSQFDLDIEFKSHQLTLETPKKMTIPQGSSTFRNCDEQKPQFSLTKLCGRDPVYVDTGAARTVANPMMLSLLSKSIHFGKGTPTKSIRGVNGKTLPAMSYETAATIAGIPVRQLVVANFRGRGGCKFPCAELILGMDTLGSLDRLKITENWISFK